MKRLTIWVLLAGTALTLACFGFILGSWLRPDVRAGIKQPAPAPDDEQAVILRIKMAVTDGLSTPPSSVKLKKNDEDWLVDIDGKTNDKLLITALSGAHKVFAEIKRTSIPIAGINLLLHSDALVDVYGKRQKDTLIFRIILTKDTFNRTDWSHFSVLNFPVIATEFWLHKELSDQWPIVEEIIRQRNNEKERMQYQTTDVLFGNGG